MEPHGKFELIVIGSGPAGEKAAVKAAYFGHKVAMIEKEDRYGGAEVVTGTLPSKTLRETALYLSGKYEKGLFGIDRDLKREASVEDFMFRKNYVTTSVEAEVRENLVRHGVTMIRGTASFAGPHTIEVAGKQYYGEYILIATGSYPYHPTHIPFDGKRVHDSDTILQIREFPHSLCVVGAGVIGCEYATIFSTMGTEVHLVNDKDHILPQLDEEVSEELVSQMRFSGVNVSFNTVVEKVEAGDKITVTLNNKKTIEVDMFLYAAGRNGHIHELHCDKIGLTVGKRDLIQVNTQYQTNIPHIYAAGDVIGYPSLASTSMDQGRVAVAYMFKTEDLKQLSSCLPYGIYTVPEVSMVGMTEKEVAEKQIPYFTGKARYADMARGQIMGAKSGFLKLVFHKSTQEILGVHIIGHIASELIHYGMTLVENKKTLYYVIEQVFNYPTLHDLYKYAAYDGLSTVSGHRVKP